MLNAAEILKKRLIDYLAVSSNSRKIVLENERLSFCKAVDVYLSTEWKRIKLETIGKEYRKNSYGSWQRLYKEYKKYYRQI